jgi:hypothetical protein
VGIHGHARRGMRLSSHDDLNDGDNDPILCCISGNTDAHLISYPILYSLRRQPHRGVVVQMISQATGPQMVPVLASR